MEKSPALSPIVVVDKKTTPWTPTSTPSHTPYTSYKECHKGTIKVFQSKKGVTLYGGGTTRDASSYNIDIIFDLANGFKSSSGDWKLPEHWKTKLAPPPTVIDMYVRDQDSPSDRADAQFWQGLWQDLIAEKDIRGHNLNVLVACQGGHGRTGTVLSCLIMAAGVIPAKNDPITWLRERYCEKAVESQDQIDYIEYIWGLDLRNVKRPSFTSSSYTPQGVSAFQGGGTPSYFGD